MIPILYALISALSALGFWSVRSCFFFIDALGFAGLSGILLGLMVCNAAIGVVRACRKSRGPAGIVGLAVSALFLVADAAIIAMSFDDRSYYLDQFLDALPYACAVAIFAYLVFFHTKPSTRRMKAAGIAATVLFAALLVDSSYSFGPMTFSARPSVFIMGDRYAVVWTTTCPATGWVEISGVSGGAPERLYDEADGAVKADSKVHRVLVDKAVLDGSTYVAKSSRTIAHLPNSALFGRTVSSGRIAFSGYSGQAEPAFLAIADVHGFARPMLAAAARAGSYDFVVLLGDAVSRMGGEGDAVAILRMASAITGGTKPVAYVRGNHETRGAYSDSLAEYFGQEGGGYDYSFRYGPIAAVVVDTGEDKADDHYEYSGLARYEPYREGQADRLDSMGAFFASSGIEHRIVLGHIPLAGLAPGDPRSRWIETLRRLGIEAQFAGHLHEASVIEPDADRGFPILVCGGKVDGIGADYLATRVEFTASGFSSRAVNRTGEAELEYTLSCAP